MRSDPEGKGGGRVARWPAGAALLAVALLLGLGSCAESDERPRGARGSTVASNPGAVDTVPDARDAVPGAAGADSPRTEPDRSLSAAAEPEAMMDRRLEMVAGQIEARGVEDSAVLRAMEEIPRHRFVPEPAATAAYDDRALPIGQGQTISQPYVVAFMAEAADIEPGDTVLEIGTGSGYGAAVLSRLAGEVYTIEIVPALAERARRTLSELGYANVEVRAGNGWLGWPERAPFDAIVVTAAPDRIPEALVAQLAVGGTLVVPVGEAIQMLRVLRKTAEGLEEVESLPVRFVPMVGDPDSLR